MVGKVAAVVLVLASIGAQGCGLTCNDIYAPSGVSVAFDTGSLVAGLYEIEMQGFNQFAFCVVELPFEEGDIVSCTTNASLGLSEDGLGIIGMTAFSFAPDSFSITATVDGTFVRDQFYTPEYDEDEPNGRNCGVRRVTNVTFAL